MNISFEFFPPRTTIAKTKFSKTHKTLANIKPEYYSVTFGAGGSTTDFTISAIDEINQSSVEAVPHISCIGSKKDDILALLFKYKKMGIKKIVAIRGDIPSGMRDIGDFSYAQQLVEFIRENFNFEVIVAAYPETHPQAKNYADGITHFVNKVAAGANYAISQYFYNIDAFLYFRDEVYDKGVTIPIIPGIMPIINYNNLMNFAKMCDAQIPSFISKKLQYYAEKNDTQSIKDFGFDIVNKLCLNLKHHGVDDFHFYTMNNIEPSLKLAQNLR